tara:strand:+ start:223 stop:435 length:213 start_codon:yes stop_codon:yes gene_type:complete
MTRRKVKGEKEKQAVEKLGAVGTYFTLLKGFVCSSILYLPKNFMNGGWMFTSGCLIFSCIITTTSAMLLL